MAKSDVASALARALAVYGRRPGSALHADSPAVARWQQGLRVVTTHPNGRSVISDMPVEFGGTGAEMTPGWYSRAGTAACTATCIAIAAELRGISLTRLEVTAESRSDARGVLGMCEADDRPVEAAPTDLVIRITLDGDADRATLEALAREGCRSSPIASSLIRTNDVRVLVEIGR
jgi:uncharacterized OsmC-like protein